MSANEDYIYSIETVESIIANPDSSWKNLFKEIIISMIATNKNDLLWYANFLSRCEYEFHFNESFVSSVYFNGNNFVIVINPLILGVIHKDQIIAILKHSAGHMINHHFIRSNKGDGTHKEAIEIAMDIVINGSRDIPYIKDLPGTGSYKSSPIKALFYQTLTEKYGVENYETGREFEYYVELITEAQEEESLKDKDENNQSCTQSIENDSNDETNIESDSLSAKTLEAIKNGNCNIDSHEFGEQLQESVGLDDNLLKSFMDTSLKEMIDDSTSFARGFMPGEASEALSKIEKRKSHKDWKRVFNKKMRNYLSNSLRYREPNKSRQHPIYQDDLDLYGYSPGKKPKLAVILDVSGSVDEKLFIALMSEIQAIQRKYSIKKVTLVQVDAEIKNIEKFGVRDKFIIRHGSGGTIMEPGFKALLQQSRRNIPDMIICATDGDIEEEFEHLRVPNKVQIIWLIDKEGKLRFDTSKYPKQQMHVITFSG